MNLPVAYLLGILALLAAESFCRVLPGSGTPGRALLVLPALLLPAALARVAVRRGRRRPPGAIAERWSPDRLALLLLRLSVVTVPLVYVALLVPGGYLDLAGRWAGESHTAELLLLLGPLLVADCGRILAEAHAAGGLRSAAMLVDVRGRLAIIALFTAPWLLLAVLGDAARGHRELYVFVVGSTVGLTAGVIAFVLLLGLLLPFLFRLLFGLSPRLPEPLGEELRDTAATLGFPRRAVLWLDSGLRAVNALLLGPLPWPRYLVVTDGLVTVLDVEALRGVVAHEVGHAQAGHPALLLALFVVAPVLLASVLQVLDIEALGEGELIALSAAVVAVGVWTLRRVSHRFEHEADVLSAVALGGAEPCIRALRRVGQVIGQSPERASLLHPSERRRVTLLQQFAADAQFRARFTLRGLRLRRAIGGLLLLAALAASWSWYSTWPVEQAGIDFYLGDFAAARERVARIGDDVPAGHRQWWLRFREDLDAATAIAGDGGDWHQLRHHLADEGFRRGVAVLLSDGPIAARPWFALSVEGAEVAPLRENLLLFCEAAQVDDADLMQAAADQIRALGTPTELRTFFGS